MVDNPVKVAAEAMCEWRGLDAHPDEPRCRFHEELARTALDASGYPQRVENLTAELDEYRTALVKMARAGLIEAQVVLGQTGYWEPTDD